VLGDLFGLAVAVPTTNAWMVGASRLVLSTAREGLLPAPLQRRSDRTGAPTMALTALVIACVLGVGALIALGLDESFAISLAAAIFLTLYIAAAVAALARAWHAAEARSTGWRAGRVGFAGGLQFG
jgi:amino acid efflux transporter